MFRSKEENDWIREEETGLFLTYEKRQKALEGFTVYLYEKEHADNTISKYRTDIRTFIGFWEKAKQSQKNFWWDTRNGWRRTTRPPARTP